MKCMSNKCEKDLPVIFESHHEVEDLPVIFCHACFLKIQQVMDYGFEAAEKVLRKGCHL